MGHWQSLRIWRCCMVGRARGQRHPFHFKPRPFAPRERQTFSRGGRPRKGCFMWPCKSESGALNGKGSEKESRTGEPVMGLLFPSIEVPLILFPLVARKAAIVAAVCYANGPSVVSKVSKLLRGDLTNFRRSWRKNGHFLYRNRISIPHLLPSHASTHLNGHSAVDIGYVDIRKREVLQEFNIAISFNSGTCICIENDPLTLHRYVQMRYEVYLSVRIGPPKTQAASASASVRLSVG